MFRRKTQWPTVNETLLADRLTSHGEALDAAQQAVLSTLVAPSAESVYLWGGVGRGKTWMTNGFYHLVLGPKRKSHLHQFLADLHTAIIQQRGSFEATLKNFLGGTRFLYLDEFHLHDVADAHLMRRTLAAARRSGIALLMTSNYPPEGLLPDPLYHHHALPLIEQISRTTNVVRIGDGVDYRVRTRSEHGFAAGAWVVAQPREDTPRCTITLSPAQRHGTSPRMLWGYSADRRVLTVSFGQLCEAPLSAADYIQLARRFAAVHLANVPPPELIAEQPMQRFAFLVDVLVNADIRLDLVSTASLEVWRTAQNLPRDADRLLSRLSLL